MNMEEKKVNKRQLEGTVVSTKMQKTVVVRVDRVKVHPKYAKRYVVSKKYKAHDEKGVATDGAMVLIEACRPISKDKRWRVVRVLTK
jgi:small subunit ribosomal protein S17